ncbi:type I restriction endonuclease [Lacticaseibacillus nasuensis]|nr:type I restriction endonuclease [Lacticaseibacillus nasuensis]
MEKEEFTQKIKAVAKRVDQFRDSLKTEEATKSSLIQPFFQAFGYDVFNPLEFIPEYTADVGIKKGEKVDYAIVIAGKLQLLVECKAINEDLNNHDSQLFRYFGTTDAKFGILSNGDEYRFFTDLDNQNKMDSEPFLTVHLSTLRDSQINELFRFTKDNFDEESISSSASQLKYSNQFRDYLTHQIKSVNEDFVRFILSNVFHERATQANLELFTPIIQSGFNQAIQEEVSDKLSSALNTSVSTNSSTTPTSNETTQSEEDNEENDSSTSTIVTTPAEIEAYTTVKIILRDKLDEERVFYRDNKSYFNVLLDDNIRKWIVRVYFSKSRNWIQLNNAEKETIDFVHPIDLVQFSDKITAIVDDLDQ